MDHSAGGLPSAGKLRRAVDAALLTGEPPEGFDAVLTRYSGAVLRHILERRDKLLLARALEKGWFTTEQLAGALKADPDLPYPLRLLLLHPEFAETAAGSVPSAGDTAPGPGVPDPAAQLERWQFDLGVAYPFLRQAVLEIPRRADGAIDPFGTDGLAFYYRSAPPADVRREDAQHMLLHCVFRHMVPPEKVSRSVWDLACDLAAEYLRCELFPGPDSRETVLTIRDALPEGCDPRQAAAVYRGLGDLFEDELDRLRRRFTRDDHRYWYTPVPGAAPELTAHGPGGGAGQGEAGEKAMEALHAAVEDRWLVLAAPLLEKKKPSHRYGLAPGSREERAFLRQMGRYDFTRYLRRFSVRREELQLDQSSFDYIPYYYGLQRYGNLPLLEPLEYTESSKIEELVIAIDTSGSCSLPTVERFLGEIERILMRRENFFKKMDIHIIQCDSIIQDHTEIRSPEDWKRYVSRLTVKGRGGTSFIPVFTLVEKLRAKGRLKHLKGLLYFTDGDGAYPREKPPYETAFVFTNAGALRRKLPEWIIPLCLDIDTQGEEISQ